MIPNTYQWKLKLVPKQRQRNKIWNTVLENVACVPEVFDFKGIVHLCEKRLDLKTRTININSNKNLMLLTPKSFRRI